MMTSAVEPATSKKIDGYDGWDVREAVNTMRRAAEIEADPKFLEVVVKEMNKEADKLEDKADLLVKTSVKLKKVFGKKQNAI
ncbi:MAG: hypothetical protein V3V89_04825 [Gammaproteobacteria bacterium]